MKLIALTLFALSATFAQAPDFKSNTGGAMAYQKQVSGLIQRSAGKVPEENYSFKPTPDVRSFGQVLGHVADAQYLFCSAAAGVENPSPNIEKSKTSKADLIDALKTAFSYCDKAYSTL